jgi:hypothetical protein
MQRIKKNKNTMTQKQYPQKTKNYHKRDQEKQGANMQM